MRVLHIHERDLKPIAPGRVAPRTSAGGDRVGGLGAYLCALLDDLSDRGVEVCSLAVGAPTGVGDPAMRYAEAESFRFRFDRARSDAIVEAASRLEPDVVHLHAAYFTLHPRTVDAIRERWPILCTVHDVTTLCFRGDKCLRGGEPCTRPVGLGCMTSGCFRPRGATDLLRVAGAGRVRAMYRSLDRLIAPSSFIGEVLRTNGCNDDRIQVVPLFSRFEPAASAPTPMQSGDPVILFAGRLDAGKGADLFIEALEALPAGDWRAELVGDGAMRPRIEQRSGRLQREGRLTMTGTLDREGLANAYRRARVVVFPSMVQESFGLVGVEAMSFSRPVVAFPSGGVTEWLEDGVTGLVAARGDAADLARCIGELLASPERARSMGESGRRRVLDRFIRRSHADQLLGLYERAARSGAGR